MDTSSRWPLHTVIGLTTALRKNPTLDRTTASLKNAGFENIHLFIDNNGSQDIDKNVYFKITKRTNLFGAWKNWFYALKELREYDQPYYCIMQDDIVLCKHINQYLYYNTPTCDCFSIFTPNTYRGINTWNRQDHHGSKLWMAQTLFFTRDAADDILSSEEVWRVPGDKSIDNRVGLWAKYKNRSICYHTPSLAQHVGHTSTLWPDIQAIGYRAAKDFVGEDFDALKLLD